MAEIKFIRQGRERKQVAIVHDTHGDLVMSVKEYNFFRNKARKLRARGLSF